MMEEMGFSVKSASPLLIDNRSAVSVAKNPQHHGRMKQLDIRFYWLRDEVENGVIDIHHIPGTEQVADILTKPLPVAKVEFCVKGMGLHR